MRSGILLIDLEYNGEPAIVLLQHFAICSDGGGRAEDTDLSEAHTASREFYEESAGAILISPEMLEKCPRHIDKVRGEDQCYFICDIEVTDFHVTNFYRNRDLIRSDKSAPTHWKEKQHLRIFYLNDIIQCLGNKPFVVPDVTGQELQISRKFIKFIPVIMDHIKDMTIPTLVLKSVNQNDGSDLPFLSGTQTFMY